MTLIIEQSTNKTTCPAGNFNSLCVGVHDLGIQPSKNGWQPRQKLAIVFEIDKEIEDGPLAGERYRISKIVSASLNTKATLMKMLTSWFGRDPTVGSNGKRRFDFETLVGRPCMLSVTHQEKDGETRATISSVSAHVDGLPILPMTSDPDDTPEWVEKMRAERLDPIDATISDIGSEKVDAPEKPTEVDDLDDDDSFSNE